MLKHRLMSDDYQRIELITGTVRRRHWTTEQKLQIIEESFQPGESVSSAARRRGVAPNLLYRWRRLRREVCSLTRTYEFQCKVTQAGRIALAVFREANNDLSNFNA
jgi:hypothetical protein